MTIPEQPQWTLRTKAIKATAHAATVNMEDRHTRPRARFSLAAMWRRGQRRRRVATFTILLLLAGLLTVSSVLIASAPVGSSASVDDKAVPVTAAQSPALAPPDWPSAAQTATVRWPSAAAVTVDLNASGSVGGLQVRVSGISPQDHTPERVRVEVLDRQAAAAAGAAVALRLSRADGRLGAAEVHLSLGYGGFRDAFGADWASRLKVSVDGAEPVSTVDAVAHTVTADLSLSGAATLVTLASGPSSETGDFSRTQLSQTSTWQAGGSSGGFSWSYPIAVPPVPGGLVPGVSIGYSSAAVDGQTAGNNVQPGWIGEGFSYEPGYIERTYMPCDQDTSPVAPYWATTASMSDLCWRIANAHLVWNGRSTELVAVHGTLTNPNTYMPTEWRLADDDGTRVEYVADLGSGRTGYWHDERWKLTTADGTQYWFGMAHVPTTTGASPVATGSVLGQAIMGNHSGEPCFSSAAVTSSWCRIAYRWSLDYVVDTHGNTMTYFYNREDNGQMIYSGSSTFVTYYRASTLARIEYGQRAGSSTAAAARIVFTTADRCWSGSCGTHDGSNWPDVPWDLECTSAPCQAPTYWTTKRLVKIESQVYTGGTSYRTVDSYDLQSTAFGTGHSGYTGVLNLQGITRVGSDTGTGISGGVVTLPKVVFGYGTSMQNRALFSPTSGAPEAWKYRLRVITTDTGRQISVNYSAMDSGCVYPATNPNPDMNTKRCLPQQYEGAWTWWHKYVVTSVVEHDNTSASPADITHTYTYDISLPGLRTSGGSIGSNTGVLWHYDGNVFGTKQANRSWSQWAGYPLVTTTTGTGPTVSKNIRLYFRGLHGDHIDSGTRTVTTTDTDHAYASDAPYRAGQLKQTITFNGATMIAKDFVDPTQYQSGTRTLSSTWGVALPMASWWTGTGWTKSMTWLAGTGTWRTSQTLNTFDVDPADGSYGNLLSESRLGDISTGLEDACTKYTYNLNTRTNLLRYDGGTNASTAGTSLADWTDFDRTFTPRDFSGDGKTDLAAVKKSDGTLWLFRGNGSGGFDAGTQIGTGWNQFDIVFSPGDFTNDGKPDILARRSSDGTLWYYRGNGTGGFTGSGTQAGTGNGWNAYDYIFSVGDFASNGVGDVIAREPDGDLVLYSGNGTGSFTNSNAIAIGTGWDSYAPFGYGDYSGDTTADIVAQGPGGLWVYNGIGNGLIGSRTPLAGYGNVGSNSGGFIAVGDITGDGAKDILMRADSNRATAVQQKETYGQPCTTTPNYPGDAISVSRYFYDQPGAATPSLTARPWQGDITRTDAADKYTGSTPNWIKQSEPVYDGWGRPTTVKDALGKTTTMTYTQVNGLTTQMQVTNPLGHQITTAQAVGRGLPATVNDANGKLTTANYDGIGRLLKVWRAGHPTSGTADAEYAYTLTLNAGLVTGVYLTSKVLGPNGNQITSYEVVDAWLRSRQTQTPTASGARAIVDTFYDDRGLTVKKSSYFNSSAPSPTLVTAADSVIDDQRRFSYDGAGRQLTEELWSLNVKKWNASVLTYDGDRTTLDRAAGGTDTITIVDALGRTSALHQLPPSGSPAITSYQYDHGSLLKTVTGPDGKQWTHSYDLLGRPTSTTDPDTGTSTASYDAAGRLTQATDSRGQVLVYTNDDLGRKTGTYRTSTSPANQLAARAYDTVPNAKGQLASATRYVGGQSGSAYKLQVTSYDDGYRPLHTDLIIPTVEGVLAGTYGTDLSYKPDGASATRTATTRSGAAVGGLPTETLTYTYNSIGQLVSLGGAQTYIADTSYTFDGLPYQQILGNAGKQVRHTLGYEASTRRLQTSQVDVENVAAPGTWIDKATDEFGHDQAGNVQWAATRNSGIRDQAECFDYDYLQRMTDAWTESFVTCDSANKQKAGSDPYRHSWTFDTAGNRTNETSFNADGTTYSASTYTYGGAGEPAHSLASVTTTGAAAGTKTYTYDPAGNTTSRPAPDGTQQTLTWDTEGNLEKVSTTTDTTFIYNPDGSRLIRRDPGGYTVLNLPDGTELRANSTGSVAGTRYYPIATRTANVDASGNLLGGTTLTWNISDHHGTGVIAVDSGSLNLSRRRSLPYGAPRGTQPTGFGTKGFVGGTADPTGLTNLGARQYDPNTGRFISVDPIFDLTNPQSMNGYTYANNAPATLSDPSGLHTPADESNPPPPPNPAPDGNCHGSEHSSGCGGGTGGGDPTCNGSEHSGGCIGDIDGSMTCRGSEHSGGCGSGSSGTEVDTTDVMWDRAAKKVVTGKPCGAACFSKWGCVPGQYCISALPPPNPTAGACISAGLFAPMGASGEACAQADNKGMYLTGTEANSGNAQEWALGSMAGVGVKFELSNPVEPDSLSGPFSFGEGNVGPIQGGLAWGSDKYGNDVSVLSIGGGVGSPAGVAGGTSRTWVSDYIFQWD